MLIRAPNSRSSGIQIANGIEIGIAYGYVNENGNEGDSGKPRVCGEPERLEGREAVGIVLVGPHPV